MLNDGQNALKNASGYFDISRKAVEVGSMEAAQLQNRRFVEISGLTPMEQTSKEIEKKTEEIANIQKETRDAIKSSGSSIIEGFKDALRVLNNKSEILKPVKAI